MSNACRIALHWLRGIAHEDGSITKMEVPGGKLLSIALGIVRCGALLLVMGAAVELSATAALAQPHLQPAASLRCDGLAQPLAVDAAHPLLSWSLAAASPLLRGVRQSRYRIIVATSRRSVESARGDVWDSRTVQGSSASAQLGAALHPGAEYWWAVRVWDQAGAPARWSRPARFITAVPAWQAQWIQAPFSTQKDGALLDGSRPMPLLRRAFTVEKAPVLAILAISGLGQYDVRLNGHNLGANALAPAWTDYRKTVIYDTYDVSGLVARGENVLGVMLGNGMYNVQRTRGRYTKFEGSFGPPKLIAELRLTFADGATQVVATGQDWKAAPGPITFSSTYGGEDFDARRIPSGWDRAGFADPSWLAAKVVDGPGGALTPAIAPPVTAVERYPALQHTEPQPGKTVYDLGQNFAGWPTVTVEGPPGAVLRLTPGELLKPDGTVSQASSAGPQWWTYTLRGSGKETWQPQFSFYGFRYVQAEWLGSSTANRGNPAKLDALAGVAVHSSSQQAGSFASSNQMLNRIHKLIVEAMRNNSQSIFTDCPHREKLGWLEETHLVAPGLMFNTGLEKLFAATSRNIADAQQASGLVPTIAPQYTVFGPKYSVFDDSPEWGSASILAPWAAYRFYGDAADLAASYPVMQLYIAYLQTRAHDGIVAYGLGDWYDIGPGGPGLGKQTTLGVTATLMLYEDAAAMRQIATLLGHPQDAASYDALAQKEKAAFNARFWNEKSGFYDRGSQTANAMPLALGLVPEDRKAAVLEHVVQDIHAHNDHLTTGEIGYPYLLRALMQAGRNDVVLSMMLRQDPPGYGAQLAAGATALTEAWDANPKSSQDHFMLGGAEEWFYRGLGGIDVDLSRANPDERITIRPGVLAGVDWVRCRYRSKLGEIESQWRRNATEATLDVTVPAGARATVYVPSTSSAVVMEGSVPAAKAKGVTLLRRDGQALVYLVDSGTYRFKSLNALHVPQ